jgi:hypothetical protein
MTNLTLSSYLPVWEIDDLPAPSPFTFSNLFKVIGPGAILFAASIGSGEWLLGLEHLQLLKIYPKYFIAK